MNVKVEKQENSKVVLEFTMSKEDFEKALDKAFSKNAKYFKVPGFRNGKVPRAIVEKTYGEGVLYETVIEDNVDVEYSKAVEENGLEVVSKPELDVKQIGKGKDFIYTVTFYVKPEVNVKLYKGLEVEKTSTRVTKKDVEAELENIRNKNARVVSVDDRDLAQNDISIIDFEGFVDGEAFEGGKAESFELTIGSGQFIAGFEEQLIGMKIGEERDINVKFPDEYHAENLAGKDAMFKVKLIGIKSKVLPDLDDEFAKDVSEFDTLEDYKKDLEKKLKEQKQKEAKIAKESKALEKLIENIEVEIPEAMVDAEVERMIEEYSANLSYQGLKIEQYCEYMGMTLEDFKKSLRHNALRDVKLRLALEFISKSEDIKAEDSEIDAKIEELINQYGNTEETKNFKTNPNIRHYITEQIINEKTTAIVVDNAVEK